jgi:hypothetical protein
MAASQGAAGDHFPAEKRASETGVLKSTFSVLVWAAGRLMGEQVGRNAWLAGWLAGCGKACC